MNLNGQFTLKLLLLLSCHYMGLCEAKGKYNVSFSEMGTCKEYDLRGTGYLYKDFFLVHKMDNNKLQPDELMHLKFYVMSAMDAHILLSVSHHPRLMDRVYEIVIGAGGNTFSAIRTSMGRRRVATNQDTQLLSIFDPTPIEIVQKKDGNLLVYIPGYKEEPLLNFTDASPLNINFISFSTFGSITARWFYDCQFDGFDSEVEEEERPLTPRQRLIANITEKGMTENSPENLTTINFAFQIRAISFQQDAAILNTRMNLIMYWNDPSLKWQPEEYDGIDTIVEESLVIWRPYLVVLNGALETLGYFDPTHQIKIQSNGSVSLLATNAELTTWCWNQASRSWPHDQMSCGLAFGLNQFMATGDATLQLEYDSTKPLSLEPVTTLSEWKFVQISVSRIENGILGRYTDKGIMQSMSGDVTIEFEIVRNSGFYKNVFSMPFLACQTLIILSFLLRGYRRGALILVVFVVIALGLMFMTRHAPPSYIPDIMHAYQHVMRLSTLCYLMHIAIIWLEMYPPKNKPYSWVMTMVNCSPLRLLLCMRIADSTEYVHVQEYPWREIAKLLNNVSFVGVNIFFFVIDIILLPSF